MASKKTTKKAATKARSGRKQTAKAPKRQRIPLADARARVTSILKDVGRRPSGELADELAGVLGKPKDWPARAPEVLARKLTATESVAIATLRRAPANPPSGVDSAARVLEPKASGSR